jgi:predicted small lipoprotein YifL
MRLLLLSIILALALAGCGRRAAPLPPGPAADVTYPHVYPAN